MIDDGVSAVKLLQIHDQLDHIENVLEEKAIRDISDFIVF